MAWALVANTVKGDAGTSSSCVTDAIDTTGATLIVLSIARDENASQINLTDSKSNTWNLLGYISQGATRNMLFYSIPTSVGSGHTFSNTGTTNFSSIAVAAFSGNAPFIITDVLSKAAASATTVAPGSITPTQDSELIVCSCAFSGTGSTPISIDDSFTETNELDFNSGVSYGSGLAYKVQTTAAASNPTWTKTGATPFVSIQASFKLSPEVSTAWLRV